MKNSSSIVKDFSSPIGRWAGVGPYYAMFPLEFTFEIIQKYSQPGANVIDPFAGRASSIFAATALGRTGCGIEINPVGWLYGKVKLNPAPAEKVIKRLVDISNKADKLKNDDLNALPEFFHVCYSSQVLKYLITARSLLRWQSNNIDATLMALMLINLHGKKSQSFSNQMRQGKAMAPDYSIRWWKYNNHEPPDLNPVEFLKKRIEWRYSKGSPDLKNGKIIQGDSLKVLQTLSHIILREEKPKYDLLFTSPPYYNITNYHYDQWLRLWLLGGPTRPTSIVDPCQGKFNSQINYKMLLETVFKKCALLMSEDAVIYIRTDARDFTFATTYAAIKQSFPHKTFDIVEQPYSKCTQTGLYGDKEMKPGEVDIIAR